MDDLHVYATDPNGVTLELLAAKDGIRARKRDERAAKETLDRWLAARGE